MQTMRQPDGTVSAYRITNPASWAALEAVKPLKRAPKGRAEKRKYPKQSTSTRDYARVERERDALLALVGRIHNNAAESPEWIRARIDATIVALADERARA